MKAQQGDVKLYQTYDNGDLEVINGVMSMSSGLDTTVYLSLFGGNEADNGSSKSSLCWWGNLLEVNKVERQYRSKTQYLLKSLPFSIPNLIRLEDAIKADLTWLKEQKIISSLEIILQAISNNTINIIINLIAQGKESQFKFTENWKDESS